MKRVGQRVADIERLHRGIAVVERVGPHPGRCQRVGAVAVGAGGRRADRRPGVGGLSTSAASRSPVAVGMPGVPLATPPASITVPVISPLITAASLAPVMVMVTTCAVPSTVVTVKRVGQRAAGVERLHRGIAVVERVGPHAGRCQRVGAVAAGAGGRRADRGPGVGRIVDVGGVEIAGRDRACPACRWRRRRPRSPRRSTSPVITAASLAPLMVMVTTCDGAVDGRGGEAVGQRLRRH